ncbi:MAG: glycosyltransferase family 9 protein [Gammaproteobacteria bacterium]|jgi:heptosyltransferase-1
MKVLIIKLGALGDIITSTSIIEQIIKHHANDEIYFLTSSGFEKILLSFEKLNIVSFGKKGLAEKIKPILWIRQNKFDRIYDLQSNDRTTLYCALSASPYRVGNHPRCPYHKHPKTKYIGECHSFNRLNQMLESADIEKAHPRPFLPITNTIISEVSEWLNKKKLSDKSFVLLHAGSSAMHLQKRWPFFSELASILNERYPIVWIGGSDDSEINKNLSLKIGIDATNQFSILALAQLGKKAAFAVTNDSAPMHILSCSDIPVFGLFGPTYARRTHALGQLENVITAQTKIAKNDQSFVPEDISNISVDKVINKLEERGLI